MRTEPLKALVIGAFVRGLSMRDVESLCEQAGLMKAIEPCWPASDRQRCCVHRARNLYAKLPERERERVKQRLLAGAR